MHTQGLGLALTGVLIVCKALLFHFVTLPFCHTDRILSPSSPSWCRSLPPTWCGSLSDYGLGSLQKKCHVGWQSLLVFFPPTLLTLVRFTTQKMSHVTLRWGEPNCTFSSNPFKATIFFIKLMTIGYRSTFFLVIFPFSLSPGNLSSLHVLSCINAEDSVLFNFPSFIISQRSIMDHCPDSYQPESNLLFLVNPR